jgi:hypothetical protein
MRLKDDGCRHGPGCDWVDQQYFPLQHDGRGRGRGGNIKPNFVSLNLHYVNHPSNYRILPSFISESEEMIKSNILYLKYSINYFAGELNFSRKLKC